MYEYISQIDITDKFNYVLLILGIIFFTNRVAPSAQTWLGLLVGLVLVYYLNSKTQVTENAFIQSMEKILADPIFQDYKNLYKDSQLLGFLDSIRIYKSDNPMAFGALLKLTDNYILQADTILTLNTSEYNEDYEQLKWTKTKILNNYQALIHTTPHINWRLELYQNKMVELEKLLNYHIDKVHSYVVTKNSHEITIRSTFPMKNDIPGKTPGKTTTWDYFT